MQSNEYEWDRGSILSGVHLLSLSNALALGPIETDRYDLTPTLTLPRRGGENPSLPPRWGKVRPVLSAPEGMGVVTDSLKPAGR